MAFQWDKPSQAFGEVAVDYIIIAYTYYIYILYTHIYILYIYIYNVLIYYNFALTLHLLEMTFIPVAGLEFMEVA